MSLSNIFQKAKPRPHPRIWQRCPSRSATLGRNITFTQMRNSCTCTHTPHQKNHCKTQTFPHPQKEQRQSEQLTNGVNSESRLVGHSRVFAEEDDLINNLPSDLFPPPVQIILHHYALCMQQHPHPFIHKALHIILVDQTQPQTTVKTAKGA